MCDLDLWKFPLMKTARTSFKFIARHWKLKFSFGDDLYYDWYIVWFGVWYPLFYMPISIKEPVKFT